MRRIWLRSVIALWLLVNATVVAAQTDSSTIDETGVQGRDVNAHLGLQFQLSPVQLGYSEELATAKKYYESGLWREAIAAVTQFVEENPGHARLPDAYFLRGESYVQLRETANVLQQFQTLLRSDPNPTQRMRARFRIAEATMLSQRYDQANDMFEAFRQRHPKSELNAYVVAYLAEIVSRTDPKRAKTLYTESIRDYPNGPLSRRARLQLAILRMQDGEYENAHDELTELLRSGQPSGQPRGEDDWTAWYWLGRAELALQKSAAGIDRLGTFVTEQPQHALFVSALWHLSQAYRDGGQLREAVALLQQLRAAQPATNYVEHALLAELQLLRQLGESEEAVSRFQEYQGDQGSAVWLSAAQLVTEVQLTEKDFAPAEETIKPFIVRRRTPAGDAEADRAHFTSLYLYALSLRGQGKNANALEVLGRIRRNAVSVDLAERVSLARIETLVETQDFDGAIQSGREFELSYPTSRLGAAVQMQMMECLASKKHWQEAERRLQQLGERPEHGASLAKAARRLADAAYRAGEYSTAKSAFATLAASSHAESDRARGVVGVAWVEFKLGNWKAAAKQYGNFVAAFPNHQDIWSVRLAYAKSLLKLEQSEKAIRVLEEFESLPVENALRPRALYLLADTGKSTTGYREESLRIAKQWLEDYPAYKNRDAVLYLAGLLQRPSKRTTSSETAGSGFSKNQFKSKEMSGDWLAEQCFSEIVDQHPDSDYWSDALYRLAALSHAQRDRIAAKRYLTKLISAERDPAVVPHALFLKGRLESDGKNWEVARQTLRDLLRRFPSSELHSVARYGVAESFFQEKNFERAYQLFGLLNQKQPFGPGESWGAMVQLRLAQLEVQKKDLVRAMELAVRIHEDYPDFALQHEADYLIGRVAAARGEFSTARAAYQRVVEADTSYRREITAMAQWMIGESYFHQKKYVVAIKAYEALVADLAYKNWQAASHLQIGKCYELLDNREQAVKSYTRVVQQFTESKWVAEAEQRLESISST